MFVAFTRNLEQLRAHLYLSTFSAKQSFPCSGVGCPSELESISQQQPELSAISETFDASKAYNHTRGGSRKPPREGLFQSGGPFVPIPKIFSPDFAHFILRRPLSLFFFLFVKK